MKKKSILMGGILLCCHFIMAQQFVFDTIWADTTFTFANSPHQIIGTRLVVFDTATLTIEAGATVSFDEPSAIILNPQATLNAIGTSTDSIFLISNNPNQNWRGIGGGIYAISGLWGTANLAFVEIEGANIALESIEVVNIKDSYLHRGSIGITSSPSGTFGNFNPSNEIKRTVFADYTNQALYALDYANIDSCIITDCRNGFRSSYYVNLTPFPGISIKNTQFRYCDIAVRGSQEEVTFSNCTFEYNGIAWDMGGSIENNSCTQCLFQYNDSAIVNLGQTGAPSNFSWQGIGSCTIENNYLGISFKGDGSPNGDGRFFGLQKSKVCNNTINIKFYSDDIFDPEESCFCEADSSLIAAKFASQNGITPNFVWSSVSYDCIPDLVYPGDTEHNQICDMNDLFPIGIHLGKTGPSRNNASLNWQPQSATNWNDTLFNGRDIKHVDADGDGSISLADTAAILQNLGLTHENLRPAGIQSDGSPLYLETNPSELPANKIINIPVYLGTLDSAITDIYGLSFELGMDMSAVENIDFIPTNSWLGTVGTDLLGIDKSLNNGIAVGLVRTDQSQVSGFGEIGNLRIQFNPTTPDTIKLDFTWLSAQAVDLTMSELSLSPKNNAVELTTGIELVQLRGVSIFPNPTKGEIKIQSTRLISGDLLLRDLQGRTLIQRGLKGSDFSIDLPDIPNGIYILEIRTSAERLVEKLQIIK
ncbi:MAG: T9SS type A sorting domain-containing protein [Bacteroidota bacterium]